MFAGMLFFQKIRKCRKSSNINDFPAFKNGSCSLAVAAEQKARVTYDNILRLSDDPDVNNVIKFLRQREINHFQRFGEALQLLREKLNQKNVYYMNPAMDM